jgi:glycosyltransferase involved in cell wall biosynthesis
MRIFLNGLASTAGGGLTYLRNVVPRLAETPGVEITLLVSPALTQEFASLPTVQFASWQHDARAAYRFWQEQRKIPQLLIESRAGLLLSAGNFAVRNSPVPQILLSRNSLYTSKHFAQDLRRRKHHAQLMRHKVEAALARWSIAWADCTIAPSKAFAQELMSWSQKNVVALHHGFDPESFLSSDVLLDPGIQAKLNCPDGALRLLFVSHYNYYRNFETLLRAAALLKRQMGQRPVRIFLTCNLSSGRNPGAYQSVHAAGLISKLALQNEIVELGPVPYRMLHSVYSAADAYVTPAYAESFAHPLVEAMASGLPIIASDLPVHREICGDAAVYFDPFSPEQLAGQAFQLSSDRDRANELKLAGLKKSTDYSWDRHVAELLALASKITGKMMEQFSASLQTSVA